MIAIIGILVALLLPAVQAAREAARRAQCTNNLKQLSLALLNYESSHRTFPTEIAPYQEVEGVEGTGESWMYKILPFVEQGAVFEAIDPTGRMAWSQGMIKFHNFNAIRTPIDVYYCPSDQSKGKTVSDAWLADGIVLAVTNYAGVLGPHNIGDASIFGGLPDCHNYSVTNKRECTGMFWRHSHLAPVKLKSITDGTSSTLAVGEVLPEFDSFKYWPLSSGTYAATHSPLNYEPIPNEPWFGWPNQIGFRSKHPGGALFAYADGHVAMFNDTIDLEVYRALSTRAGGEVVSPP